MNSVLRNHWILPVCLCLGFFNDLAAQGPMMLSGGGSGKAGLALQGRVAKELGIAADTEKMNRLRELANQITTETRDGLKKLRDEGRNSDDDRTKFVRSVRDGHEADLKRLLSESQYTRLKQIDWQVRGPLALTDPEFAKALELTPEQLEQLETVNRDFLQKQQSLFKEKPDVAVIKIKVDEYVIERDNDIAAILTKSQKNKKSDLLGPLFDFTVESATQPK